MTLVERVEQAEAPSLYGPDGFLAKFIALCHALEDATRKIKEDEARRSYAYELGYRAALRARGEG